MDFTGLLTGSEANGRLLYWCRKVNSFNKLIHMSIYRSIGRGIANVLGEHTLTNTSNSKSVHVINYTHTGTHKRGK